MARSPRNRDIAYQEWQKDQYRPRSCVSHRTSRGPPQSYGRWPPWLGNALARDADVERAGRRRTPCTEAHSFWVMTSVIPWRGSVGPLHGDGTGNDCFKHV